MQFVYLNPMLVITSLLLRFMKIIEYENERIEKNIHTIHIIEHKMYQLQGKPNTGENPARRWGLCSILFSSVMGNKYK